MKRKRVRVMVGFVLVCLLTGTLGVYSASGWNEVGLTYRLNDWGGVKIYTQSGFGGELLLGYYGSTSEYSKITQLNFQPSLLYRFKGSSYTSPYVGIGYLSSTSTYESSISEIHKESGFALLVGLEHFFGKKFSCDLRATAYLNAWEETGFWEDQGTRTIIYIDLGVSIYR